MKDLDLLLSARGQLPSALALSWATVEGVGPLRVRVDAPGGGHLVPGEPFTLVGDLRVSDRVAVGRVGGQLTIVGRSGGVPVLGPNEIIIDGAAYARSGSWGVSVPSWSVTSDPYAASLQLIPPYVPPEGWAFHCYVLVSSSFTFVDTAAYSAAQNRVQVRILQRGNNSLTALSRVGWELVKQ